MSRCALPLLAALVGCVPTSPTPFYALDPIYLEPTPQGVYGVQSWELFSEEWGRRFAARHYLCAVIVELEGIPTTEGCPECSHRFRVEATLLESDCDAAVAEDPRFLALAALGLGEDRPEVEAKVPHPDASSGAWADYGEGWEPYGWAWPEELDHGGTPASTEWDEARPFQLWPAYVWELTD